MLIERAVRKHVLARKPYQDLDYVMALDDTPASEHPFSRSAGRAIHSRARGEIPPLVQLSSLLHATDAVHGETETAKDLRYLLGPARPSAGHGQNRPSPWPMEDLPSQNFPSPTTSGILRRVRFSR